MVKKENKKRALKIKLRTKKDKPPKLTLSVPKIANLTFGIGNSKNLTKKNATVGAKISIIG